MERFSTSAVASCARRRYWSDVVAQTFPGLAFEGPEDYRGDLQRWSLGSIGMATARSSHARVHQRRGSTDEHRVLFHLQRQGRLTLTQGTREASVGAGAITIADSTEPYAIAISDRNDCLILTVPLERLGDSGRGVDWRAAVIGQRDPGALLLFRVAEVLWDAHALGTELDQPYEDALIGAIRAAVSGRDLAPARLAEADPVAFALRHLSDPALSTSYIAHRVGLSPRGVQKAFLRTVGGTPTDFIVERRLARAAELLGAPQHETITDIALAVGFSDSSQFCRRFREHYDTTPSKWRVLNA